MVNLPARSESITVPAAPAAVWSQVTDLRAMARRSPELVGMWVLGRPGPGRWSVNLNRRGWFCWPTIGRIVAWSAPDGDGRGRFAFTVWPTDVEWSYEVEATETGTRLTERRTAVVDPSLVVRLTARLALGGQEAHDDELVDGMRATLAAIEADVRS
jgi:hypothetical protein